MTQAKKALHDQKLAFVDQGKNMEELNDLDIGDDIISVLQQIVDEIEPVGCYVGSRPPMRSYEKMIEGKELFAFSWLSSFFGKKMYLKFAIKGDYFCLVSLHEDH